MDKKKKKDKLVDKTVKNIMFGRKIMYDLSYLVYNDTIQNSCILKLLLFTSVLFDILGCFEPELLMKCNTGCASCFAAVYPMECMLIKPLYIFIL